jgi:hypothetical protein
MADLQHELAAAGEFQDLAVLGAVAADPDEALGIDVDAVLVGRPLIALGGPAPALDNVLV